MKRAPGVVATFVVVLFVRTAAAQSDEPPPPLPPPTVTVVQAPPPVAPAQPAPEKTEKTEKTDKQEEKPKGPKPVPDARTGFQLALRTGVMVPMGKVASGTAMYDVFSPQAPFELELGAKVIPQLFLGVYLGLAVGGVNNRLSDLCDRTNADCGSASFRAGIEAQWHFAPARRLDPWIGYGIGLEGAGVGNTVLGTTTTTAWSGFDFAKISGGFDVRISRVIGIGPLIDLTFGRFAHTMVKVGDTQTVDDSIDERRTHAWLTIGGRLVFFP